MREPEINQRVTTPDDSGSDEEGNPPDEAYDYDDGASWYCDHDVPNGCNGCAQVHNERLMLDAMTDTERQVWLYGGTEDDPGTFATYFAPWGPAWQAEERERRGER